MRVVGRHDDVVVADRLHDLAQHALVGVGGHVALAEEVLARRAETFTSEPGPNFSHASSSRHSHHGSQPHVPSRNAQRSRGWRSSTPPAAMLPKAIISSIGLRPALPIRRPLGWSSIAARDVVAQRRLPGGMEADRHAQLLHGGPQRLELRIVDVAAVDRVGVADHRHRAQLAHGPPGLGDGRGHVVEGQLGGELQPRRGRSRSSRASSCCARGPAPPPPRGRGRRASAPGGRACRRARRRRCPRCPSPAGATRRRSRGRARPRCADAGRRLRWCRSLPTQPRCARTLISPTVEVADLDGRLVRRVLALRG